MSDEEDEVLGPSAATGPNTTAPTAPTGSSSRYSLRSTSQVPDFSNVMIKPTEYSDRK